MVSATKIVEELIGISILGAIYILAFAPIQHGRKCSDIYERRMTDAVANYTGGGAVGTALGVVVGYSQNESENEKEVLWRPVTSCGTGNRFCQNRNDRVQELIDAQVWGGRQSTHI